MVLDIPVKIFFGTFTKSPFDASARGFSSKDIKAAPKYLMKLYKYLGQHNVIKRSNQLVARDTPNHVEAERIDRDLTRGCRHAEKCYKRRHREYWTVELHRIRQDLVIWCTLKYRKRQKRQCDPLINCAQSIGLPVSETMTIDEINDAIGRIRNQIRDLHIEAREHRDQHLIHCLNIAKELSKDEKASIIKNIMTAERRNEAFCCLKYYRRGSTKSQAINVVTVPTS